MSEQHIFKGAVAPATPPSNAGHHYINTANGDLYLSKGNSSVADWVLMGKVFSVNGLTGAVTITGTNTGFTPDGDITATTVQTAIVEVRDDTDTKLSGKANTVHTHTSAAITDFTEAAQDAVGSILTDTSSIAWTYNDAGNTISADLTSTTVAAGSYGSPSSVGTFTVDAQGRLTAASSATISITSSNVSNFTTAAQSAAVQNSLTASTVIAPSATAVNTALALKVNLAGDTMTGALNVPSVSITGTAGAGFVNYLTQSSAPATPASGFNLFADSSGRFSWKGTNGFVRTFNATGITADRTYSFPDTSGTFLLDPMTTAGDILYRNGSNVNTRLPIGITDQLLRVSGGVPIWSDENLGQDFGDGLDGSATLNGALSLTGPKYYDTLTITAGAAVTMNGYPIYCKVLDLTNATTSGVFKWNGNNGATTATQAGGAGGAAVVAAMLSGGVAGGTGATGVVGAGAQAATTTAQTPANGGASNASGAGGAGNAGANAGGAARAGVAPTNRVTFGRFEQQFMRGAALILGGCSGAGGGSGGGDGTNLGRGGGGGGGTTGVMAIYADEIITSASTASGIFQCLGGKGGNGATGAAGNAGGGGGGAGGGGGYIFIAYNLKTGPVVTNIAQATGGTGGNGSNGAGTGAGGNGGFGGNGGYIDVINFGTLTGQHIVGSSGTSGSAATGATGGAGGAGGACNASF